MKNNDLYRKYIEAFGNSDLQDSLARLIIKEWREGNREVLPPEIGEHAAWWAYIEMKTGSGMSKERLFDSWLQLDGVRYIRWVNAGLIKDKAAKATVAVNFEVSPSSVTGWLKTLSDGIDDPRTDRTKQMKRYYIPSEGEEIYQRERPYQGPDAELLPEEVNVGDPSEGWELVESDAPTDPRYLPEGWVKFRMELSGKKYKMRHSKE